jgi:acyl-CoA thioesterase FadM
MGIYMNVIQERATLQQLQLQPGLGEKPPPSPPDHFTASLKVDYLRPVRAPGAMAITVRREREEGRKVWLRAEVRQGEEVVCAKGEALWIGVVVGRGKL